MSNTNNSVDVLAVMDAAATTLATLGGVNAPERVREARAAVALLMAAVKFRVLVSDTLNPTKKQKWEMAVELGIDPDSATVAYIRRQANKRVRAALARCKGGPA